MPENRVRSRFPLVEPRAGRGRGRRGAGQDAGAQVAVKPGRRARLNPPHPTLLRRRGRARSRGDASPGHRGDALRELRHIDREPLQQGRGRAKLRGQPGEQHGRGRLRPDGRKRRRSDARFSTTWPSPRRSFPTTRLWSTRGAAPARPRARSVTCACSPSRLRSR